MPGPPTPADVALHYDELDDVYRRVWSDHAHHGLWWTGRESIDEAVAALVDLAADRAGIGSGSRVVDVGSGYGATGRRLARLRDARVTSFTISGRQFDYARAADLADPRLRHELRNWLDSGLPAAAQDAALAIESINHMPIGPALTECLRVLRPGGVLVLVDLVTGDHVPRWQVRPLLRRMEAESHLRELPDLAAFTAEVADAGFAVDAVLDLTRQAAPTWTRAIRRMLRLLPGDRVLRRAIFSGEYRNAGFALAVLRMVAGYRLGAVRYCLVVARRPNG